MIPRAVLVLLVCTVVATIDVNGYESRDPYYKEQQYDDNAIRVNRHKIRRASHGAEMDPNSIYKSDKSVFCYVNGTSISRKQRHPIVRAVDIQNELSDFDKFNLEDCTYLVIGAYLDNNFSVKGIDLQFKRKIIYGLKSKYNGLKILLAIFMSPELFATMVRFSNERNRFLENTVHFINDGYIASQFDGLVVDGRFPIQRPSHSSVSDNSQFVIELMRDLKAALGNKSKLLAVTLPPAVHKHNVYRFQELLNYVDYFIITTDFHGHQSEIISPAAPIRSRDGFNVESTVDAVVQAVGSDKAYRLILAIPFYGKRYQLFNDLSRDQSPIGKTFRNHQTPASSGIVLYKYSCLYKNSIARAGYYWRYGWDETSKTPWLVNSGQAILYEDEQSVREKAILALKKGLGGVITYSLNMDDYEGKCAANHRRSVETNNIQRKSARHSKRFISGKSPLLQVVSDVVQGDSRFTEDEPDQTTLRYHRTNTPSYDQANTQSYAETNIPNYDQTNTPSYDQTSIRDYDQTSASNYDQSNIPSYSQTNTPGHDQTNIPRYGQMNTPGYDQTNIPSYGQTNIETYDHTDVSTYDYSESPQYKSPRRPLRSIFCYVNASNVKEAERFELNSKEHKNCTHLVIGGAHLDRNYNIIEPYIGFEHSLIDLISKHDFLQVLLSISGDHDVFANMSRTPHLRNQFIQRAIYIMGDNTSTYDGIVIDWTFDVIEEFEVLTDLMQNLKDNILKSCNKSLAMVIPPKIPYLQNGYRFDRLLYVVDYFIIMAMEYQGHLSDIILPNAPVHSRDGFNVENTVDSIVQAVGSDNAYRLILAIPFYGKRYQLSNDLNKDESPIGKAFRNHQTPAGSGIVLYKYSCLYKNSPARAGYYWRYGWDETSKTPWLVNSGQAILYEDEQSVREKAKLALKKGLGGVITYSLHMDDYEGTCAATYPRSVESNYIQRSSDRTSKPFFSGKSPLLQVVYDVIQSDSRFTEEGPDQTTLRHDQTNTPSYNQANTPSYDQTNPPNYEQTNTPGYDQTNISSYDDMNSSDYDQTSDLSYDESNIANYDETNIPINDHTNSSSYDHSEPAQYKSPQQPLRSIFCYVNASNIKETERFELNSEDHKNCTHLVIGGAYLDRNYNIIEPYIGFEHSLNDLISKRDSLQVLLSISGDHDVFANMSRTLNLRNKFVQHATYTMGDNAIYDGIIIDWTSGVTEEFEILTDLMEDLRDNNPKNYNKSLAIVLPPTIQYLQNGYRFDRLLYVVDYFIIMAMEYHGHQSNRILPNAPIHSQTFETEAFNVESTVDAITKAIGSDDTHRLILAIPFYGKRYQLYNELGRGESPIGNPFQNHRVAPDDGIVSYRQACLYKNSPARNGDYWRYGWDETSKTPWLVNGLEVILYEDRLSIRRKAALAFEYGKGLSGVMLYSLEMDDYDGGCTAAQRPDSSYWIKPDDARAPLLKTVYDVAENGLTPAERLSMRS